MGAVKMKRNIGGSKAKDALATIWLKEIGISPKSVSESPTEIWLKKVPASDFPEFKEIAAAADSGDWAKVTRIAERTRSDYVEKYAILEAAGAGKQAERLAIERAIAGKKASAR